MKSAGVATNSRSSHAASDAGSFVGDAFIEYTAEVDTEVQRLQDEVLIDTMSPA